MRCHSLLHRDFLQRCWDETALPQECLESVVVKLKGMVSMCTGVCFRDTELRTQGRKLGLQSLRLKAVGQPERAESNSTDERNYIQVGGSRFSELRRTKRQASSRSLGAVRGADRALPLFNFWAVCREPEVGRRSEVLSHDQITISRQFVIECRKVGHWGKSMIWTKAD